MVRNYLLMQGEQRTIHSLAIAYDTVKGYFVFRIINFLGCRVCTADDDRSL